jgi:hypothetical protein
MAAFQTLLGLAGHQPPATYRQIYAEGPVVACQCSTPQSPDTQGPAERTG